MENFDTNAIISRIKHLRKQFAGERGKSEFAKALGISPSTYSYYENDRIPPIEILLKMSQVTAASLEWLITGQTAEKTPFSGPNISLLRKLDSLLSQNPELTEPILAFVELLSEKKNLENRIEGKTISPGPGWIPVLGRTAAGMVHCWDQVQLPDSNQAVTELDALVKKHLGKEILGSLNAAVAVDLQSRAMLDNSGSYQANIVRVAAEQHDQIAEFVECERIHSLFPDSFALHIDGDSMTPKINDGDIVIISASLPAQQGQIAVAKIADQIGVTCKIMRITEKDVHLIPINERYETKVVPKKELLWAQAVLCHISM